MSTDRIIALLISDWFSGLSYWGQDIIGNRIDFLISEIHGPLTQAEDAWRYWNDRENDFPRRVSHHAMMDLCKYAEWCAETELGSTTEPFSGVPRLVLTIGQPA